MSKRTYSFLAACLLLSAANAQDTIITNSGDRILAIVKSISSTDIEYKKADNPTGPSYMRTKQETASIHYKNGTMDVFTTTASANSNSGNESSATGSSSNSTQLTMSNVFSASQILFYGFDFSNAVLIEPKRMGEGQKIKDLNFPQWNEQFQKDVPAGTLARWMRKSFVNYNFDVVTKANAAADPSKIVGASPSYENMNEKIKKSISNYAASDSQKEGIGFVVNVEYLYKAKEETSAYFTFFDIATHAVIRTDRVTVKKAGGAGLTNYWETGLQEAMRNYIDRVYKKY